MRLNKFSFSFLSHLNRGRRNHSGVIEIETKQLRKSCCIAVHARLCIAKRFHYGIYGIQFFHGQHFVRRTGR